MQRLPIVERSRRSIPVATARVHRIVEFSILHAGWMFPGVWVGLTAVFTAGGATVGFDPEALPWIGGVVGALVAGVLAGLAAVWRGRRAGWCGVCGWTLLPIVHLVTAARAGEGWAPTFFADLFAVLAALVLAAVAIVAAFFPAVPGSRWQVLTGPAHHGPHERAAATTQLLTAAAVCLAGVTFLISSCGQEVGETGGLGSSAVTSTTSLVPASSVETTSTPAPTSTSFPATTAPAQQPELPALLVAHPRGINLFDSAGGVSFLDGVDVALAFPDMSGGVVYQEKQRGSWREKWDDATRTVVLEIDEEPGPFPIMRLSVSGGPPATLIPVEGAEMVTLNQVVELDGHPVVVFSRKAFSDPGDAGCMGDPHECAWNLAAHHLVLLDLVTGQERDLGGIGSFESAGVSVEFSESKIGVTTQNYGEGDPCGAVYPRAFIDPPIDGRWLGEGGTLWRACEFGPTVGCDRETCIGRLVVALDPEGDTVAYAQALNAHHVPWATPAELVVLDVETRIELLRVEIGPPGSAPSWIEWDGRVAVIGREGDGGELAPVSVTLDGALQELEMMGRITFWRGGD